VAAGYRFFSYGDSSLLSLAGGACDVPVQQDKGLGV